MTRFALAALLLAGPRDPWFGPDKIKHFLLAAFTQSVAHSALRLAGASRDVSLVGASATAAAASILKEVYDKRQGRIFSPRDLVWDAAGAGSATIVLRHSAR